VGRLHLTAALGKQQPGVASQLPLDAPLLTWLPGLKVYSLVVAADARIQSASPENCCGFVGTVGVPAGWLLG